MADPEKPVQRPNVNPPDRGPKLAPKPDQNTPADPRIPVPNLPQKPQAAHMPQEQPDLRAAQAKAAAQASSASAVEAAKAAVIKHVWTSEDTYADLAFKYYGSIKEPYWRLIYNHNKAIIGNHPNDIRVGLEIEIPPLPDELKK